jgi:transketolase
MEGISHETAAFAGHNKLDNLIVFYDNNKITIDGSTDLAMSEDVAKRFEAYGWHVQHVTDVNDLSALESAVKTAKAVAGKPHLIITDTHIGYGSPHKQDTASVHGSPLGEEEVRLTKKNLGWDENKEFFIPEDVKEFFESLLPNFQSYEDVWQSKFDAYQSKYPTEAREFKRIFQSEIPELKWEEFKNYGENVATRSASGKVLNSLAEQLPELFGGSADLHPSNNTYLKNYKDFSANNYLARNIHFGIREHGMAAIMNGMAYYGGIIPYGGTFLVFSDYLRPAIRLAAMSHLRVIYVFTHDSIGLGEDGPTHQPIEHLASLRAIPGLIVLRPADANETVYAWKIAIETKNQPVALILSRQKLPILDREKYTDAEGTLKGAYILKHEKDTTANIIIIATGSEVALALEAAEVLEKEGKSVRVVSMPSTEIFEMQSDEYKREVLPENIQNRIIIEAGVSQGWEKYAGCKGKIISVEKYGASAPYKILFEKYGFTVEKILETAQEFF